jgi:hypothetical protein
MLDLVEILCVHPNTVAVSGGGSLWRRIGAATTDNAAGMQLLTDGRSQRALVPTGFGAWQSE